MKYQTTIQEGKQSKEQSGNVQGILDDFTDHPESRFR